MSGKDITAVSNFMEQRCQQGANLRLSLAAQALMQTGCCAGTAHATALSRTAETLCASRAEDDNPIVASAADALQGQAAHIG